MSTVGLTLRQVKYTNTAFWRNPASAFFTFAFPLMFLIIFTAIFGGTTTTVVNGHALELKASNYYIPAIATFSIITATYTNLSISLTFLRDAGILKRVRGTPLEPSAYLSARIIHAVLMSLLLVAIVVVFGIVAYSADLPVKTLPAFIVTVIIGAASFAALGLAVTSIVPNADAAPAVVNATVLPLLFLSGVFIPLSSSTAWYVQIAKLFPVYHFSQSMMAAYFGPQIDPTTNGFHGWDLLIVAAWGLAGAIVATRSFRWEAKR
ncbi:MAG TPA: ABC transporter permease [Actinomycetota bacterium]|nr:ABC transporter permease [Actinomycetota bacterium]